VHAHIILWMNQVDIEQVTNEITAATPAIFATTIGEFLEHVDSHQNKLFKIVMRKQLHICNSRCQQQTNGNDCKYGFPFKPHIEERTTYDSETKRWEYYNAFIPVYYTGVIFHFILQSQCLFKSHGGRK